MYLTTNCSNLNTGCVAGDDTGNPEELTYVAEIDAVHYLIADGYQGTDFGEFTIDIVVE